MAGGYTSAYSGDGYARRLARTGSSSGRNDEDFRNRTQEYRDEQMYYNLREQERERSLNESARSTFSSAWDSIRENPAPDNPMVVARDYVTHASKLKTYMESGQLEKAFGEYSILASARDNGGDDMFNLSATDPRRTGSRADADLQTGAQYVTRSEFDAISTVVKQTGETATAYDLFHDGQAYKKFETGNALARNFGSDLVKAISSDDEFERRIATRISESVVSGTGAANRLQYRDLGDYVFKNGELGAIRDELGDEGAERLVEDALVNGIADGTFKDRMDFVRDVVYQQRQANPTKDAYRLVRDNLNAFNRKVKVVTSMYPSLDPDSTRRCVAKMMTMAAEEAPGAIDFDDEKVSERLDRWFGLAARSEQLGIPLLVDGHEGGLAVRKALAESITPQSLAGEPSETEALARLERAFDRAGSVLSAGAAPASSVKNPGESAKAIGYTTGNHDLDGAIRLMESDLLKDHVLPQMYRGTREDVALRSLSYDVSSRDRLTGSWGRAISVSTGLSEKAGAFVASALVGKAFRDGGTSPVDVRAELTAAAFAQGVPTDIAKELRRYVKVSGLVDDSKLDSLLAKYRVSLSDPLVGHGITRRELTDALVADMKNRMAAVMENGGDPSVVSEAAARMGYPFQWTGQWILADGTPVTDKEYKNRKAVGSDGKERSIDVGGAVPAVGKSQTLVDLDDIVVTLPAFGGQSPVNIPRGSWTGNENGFRGVMAYMKRVADLSLSLQRKRSEAAAKGSASADAADALRL